MTSSTVEPTEPRVTRMHSSTVVTSLILLFLLLDSVVAQLNAPSPPPVTSKLSFSPSVKIMMGIFAVLFTFTALLLAYARFYHVNATEIFNSEDGVVPTALLRSGSGVEKGVIQSLPYFRFASLKGAREGLECAVCLAAFEDAEVLRLLPKCKHAFHVDCVDRWLEGHSSCPLCRHKVDADDSTTFGYSASSRSLMLQNPSCSDVSAGDIDQLELFVEREPGGRRRGSSRFGSFRKVDETEGALLAPDGVEDKHDELKHKFKHKIIVSDVVLKRRWSDVNSSDLMSLNCDMLSIMSSKRFDSKRSVFSEEGTVVKIKEEMEKKRRLESKARQIAVSSLPEMAGLDLESAGRLTPGNRCMSEMTNVQRFRVSRESSGDDERVGRAWLPTARRTVQWFAGREKRSQAEKEDMNV